jgi:hypothetical protein
MNLDRRLFWSYAVWALATRDDKIIPAIKNESTTAGPAIPDATPLKTKIPAPIIAPMHRLAAPKTPSVLFNSAIFLYHYFLAYLVSSPSS